MQYRIPDTVEIYKWDDFGISLFKVAIHFIFCPSCKVCYASQNLRRFEYG